MKKGWTKTTLGDLCDNGQAMIQTGPFGSQLHSYDYQPAGVPVVPTEAIRRRRITDESLPRVSAEVVSRLARHKLRAGDILFARRGAQATGLSALVEPKNEGWLCGTGAILLRLQTGDVDPTFLSFVLSSEAAIAWLKAHAVGAVMPNLNEGVLRRLPLLLPPWGDQRAIGHMLSTLDDKIELNRRMNETLEAMAQTVFKSWFLDGSEAGSPKAWRSAPLPEAIEINPTRPLRKGEVAPYVDMPNLPTRGHCALNMTNRKFGSGMRFKNGDTLLARITPCLENGKTAFVDWLEDEQVGWGSTEYIVLRPKPPLPPEFGYYLARSEELRSYAIQKMTGTSGRQRVPVACFEQFEIAVPPESLAKRFGEIAHKHMALIRANDEQNRTLSSLRDALLPKLLSGEVRLKPQTESSQEMPNA